VFLKVVAEGRSKNLICNRFVWVASIDVTKSSEFKKCAKTNFPILHTFILKNPFFDLRRRQPQNPAGIDPAHYNQRILTPDYSSAIEK